MIIKQTKCDFCGREIQFEDNKGKSDKFFTPINVKAEGDKGSIIGEFCSSKCVYLAIEKEVKFGSPIDVLQEIAKSMGYSVTKINKQDESNNS